MRRVHLIHLAVFAASIAAGGRASAIQDHNESVVAPAANGALSIIRGADDFEETESIQTPPGDVGSSTDDHVVNDSVINDETNPRFDPEMVTEAEADADGPAESPQDGRPLGRDSGLLRLGQAPAESDESDESSWLGRFFGGSAGESLRIGGALAAVIGLLLLLGMGARRIGGGLGRAGRPSGVLEILARYPVGRRQCLVLLKLDRRILLVHQTGASMTTLTEVADPREVASLLARVEAGSRSGVTGRFQKALQSASGRYDDRSNPIETVDLTRSQGGGLRALRRRAAA